MVDGDFDKTLIYDSNGVFLDSFNNIDPAHLSTSNAVKGIAVDSNNRIIMGYIPSNAIQIYEGYPIENQPPYIIIIGDLELIPTLTQNYIDSLNTKIDSWNDKVENYDYHIEISKLQLELAILTDNTEKIEKYTDNIQNRNSNPAIGQG